MKTSKMSRDQREQILFKSSDGAPRVHSIMYATGVWCVVHHLALIGCVKFEHRQAAGNRERGGVSRRCDGAVVLFFSPSSSKCGIVGMVVNWSDVFLSLCLICDFFSL